MAIGNPHEPVFAPAVCARAGVVMREEIPRRAPGAVVFTHRAPLTLRKVRSPALPVDFALARLLKAFFFSIHRWSPVLRSNSEPSTYEREMQVALCDS